MTDAGFIEIVKRLLAQNTRNGAREIVAKVGDEYRDLSGQLAERIEYKRTNDQNALLHQWFKEIADHYGDRSARQVKGECHRDIGLTYRLRDPVFAWVWKHTGPLLTPEQQAEYLVSGAVTFSSAMNTATLSEYMDEIERTYRMRGVRLTIPEMAE